MASSLIVSGPARGQREAFRAGGAGIEEQRRADPFDGGLVCVAEDAGAGFENLTRPGSPIKPFLNLTQRGIVESFLNLTGRLTS
jgi:hypothetical protein